MNGSRLSWSWVDSRLRPGVRLGIAGFLFVPGVSKLFTYDQSVQFFSGLGIPSPELLVAVVGVVELAAALTFVLDRAAWIGALVTIPIMVVAATTAGPTWQNIGVLGAALLVVALEVVENRIDTDKP